MNWTVVADLCQGKEVKSAEKFWDHVILYLQSPAYHICYSITLLLFEKCRLRTACLLLITDQICSLLSLSLLLLTWKWYSLWTALFWIISQWIVVISYRRFGTTCQPHPDTSVINCHYLRHNNPRVRFSATLWQKPEITRDITCLWETNLFWCIFQSFLILVALLAWLNIRDKKYQN